MAVGSTASSSLAVSGLASGIDTDSIVTQLMDIEKVPYKALETKEANYNKELTSWRSLNTRLLGVDTAISRMQSTDLFAGRKATSSDETLMKVTTSAGKDLGDYTFTVSQLAQRHQNISQGFAETTSPMDISSFKLKVGTAEFDSVSLKSEDRTLSGLRDAINKSGVGVRASIVDAGEAKGASRYSLMLTANDTGAASAVSMTFETTGTSVPAFNVMQQGQDAIVKLGKGANAIEVTSAKNVLTGVIEGVSLELISANPAKEINVSLQADSSTVKSAVSNLLNQYNAVADFFGEQFAYDSDSQSTGTLFGNTELMNLQSSMVNAMTDPRRGLALNSLAAIGISLDQTGHLAIKDSTAFDKALKDPAGLQALFNDPTNGVVTKLDKVVESATLASIGTVTSQEGQIQERIAELGKRKLAMLRTFDTHEAALRTQFSKMEQVLASLKSQGAQLAAQLSG